MSSSLRPMDCEVTRLLCPWDSQGKNTGVVCHVFSQGIFLMEGLDPCFLHLLRWEAGSLPLVPSGKYAGINKVGYKMYTF